MTGMMIHQDGSTHEWIPALEHNIDLIVTMDDADSEITSGFFVDQEGIWSTFQGLKETIEKYGLFCSLYTDRGTHYWYTPEAGGKVDKHQLTQVGRALKQLGIQHIAAYSPQARGRSERMFGTLQNRLPQEIALAGIRTLDEANRYLREFYLPRHNEQFKVKAKDEKTTAYIPWGGPKDDLRHHYVRTTVEVRQYSDMSLGLFFGNRCLGRYDHLGNLKHSQ